VAAARRTANKLAQREALSAAGLPVPRFQAFPIAGGPEAPAAAVGYPCVLKPLGLSASRGVIRANHPASFREAWRRIQAILAAARTERTAAILLDQYRGVLAGAIGREDYGARPDSPVSAYRAKEANQCSPP
jgi:biotin carboxylase